MSVAVGRVFRRPGTAPAVGRAGLVALCGILVLLLLVGPGTTVAPASGARPASTSASGAPETVPVNSSWENISGEVGTAPEARSLTQAAYSPSLGAVVLFGGYNGDGGNFALGDTWTFHDQQWTEISPSGGPSPRWGGGMVYDPATESLILFGGRNDTTFYNDTWSYNGSGWHLLATTSAPSPRYDFGYVWDPTLNAIVLFGGARGNVPAGTFSDFVFFTDTWTFANGTWTNITSTSGAPPVGRLIRGQMAYDAADGYIVLDGGYEFATLGGTCGLATFSTQYGETWSFGRGGGGWSQIATSGRSPSPGIGEVWYDSEANLTLYYEGLQEESGGSCGTSGNEVWSYSAGTWTLVTEGNISAPLARFVPMFLDDVGDHEQLEFGGEYATGTEYAAGYAHDTWTYQPTWLTFEATDLPTGADLEVRLLGQVLTASTSSLLFVDGPGTYGYHYTAVRDGATVAENGSGTVSLGRGPEVVALTLVASPPPVPSPARPSADPFETVLVIVGGVALGGLVGATFVLAARASTRRQLRREGELLVEAITPPAPGTEPAPPRPPGWGGVG